MRMYYAEVGWKNAASNYVMSNKTNRKQVHTCQRRRRNHKLKLVSWSIIFRGQSTEENSTVFPRLGQLSAEKVFHGRRILYCDRLSYRLSYPTLFSLSLYNPSDRPTTRIIAPEISMASLSFILCRSTFFSLTRALLRRGNYTRYEFSKSQKQETYDKLDNVSSPLIFSFIH